MDDDDVPQLIEAGTPPPELEPKSYERDKVPITLLTGYLGAGKSTLLQYILTAEHGYRIAVCMNDFGDTTDIESKSLQMSNPTDPDAPTSNLLSLPNGCLCCSVKDLGIAAIEEMVAAQRDKIDWVIVELTGLADPAPIAKSFWANEEMGDLILDSIVCVVDSRNVLKQLAEEREDGSPNEAQKQVACADVILLNKADIVTPTELDEVAATVASINPTLRVHTSVRGEVPLSALHDLRAYTSPAVAALPEPAACNCSEPGHKHAHAHGSGPNVVSTVTIPLPVLCDERFAKVNAFLEALLWENRWPTDTEGEVPEILRTKGYALLEDGSARVIQGVVDLFEVSTLAPAAAANGNAEPQPKVVFIGRNVDDRLVLAMKAFVGL